MGYKMVCFTAYDGQVISHYGKEFILNGGDKVKVLKKRNYLYINDTPLCSGDGCMKEAKWALGPMATHLCSKCSNSDKYHMMKIYVSIDKIDKIREERLAASKASKELWRSARSSN